MPVASTIAINDSVPTSRDFDPRGDQGPAFLFKNSESDTGAGQMALTLSLSEASSQRPTHRAKFALAIPVEHTVDGVVQIAHTLRFNGEFVIPQEATALSRADLYALATNALAHATLKGYVEDLEKVW